MNHSVNVAMLVEHWHGHDTVTFHAVHHRASEFPKCSDLGRPRHHVAHRQAEHALITTFDETREVAAGQHTDETVILHDDGDAAAFGEQHDRFAHRRIDGENWD